MRVIALLATHNEERFIVPCLDHLAHQGVEVYLIDNESEDETVPLARQFLGRGLVGIETLPRGGVYRWEMILQRKEQLAASLEAEWFMHVDADEVRLPPASGQTLGEALAVADHQGFNAVNFLEYTFVPTRESPDHDHPDFLQTMRWYYPFLPSFPHRLNAWKKQRGPVELAWSGGHLVRFPGLRMSPTSFAMRHYLFLSVPHAERKWVRRTYLPEELDRGWHGARAGLRADRIALQVESELRRYVSDDLLDPTRPLQQHPVFAPHETRRGETSVEDPAKSSSTGSATRDPWPIIVGGCYRSGTSVLRRVLNAHSRIYCGPEVKFFRDFYADYRTDPIRHLRFTQSARAILPEPDLLAILGGAFIATQQRAALLAGKVRWADKNPENVLYLDRFQDLLGPSWLFVHVVRNPLDTLASMKEIGFPLTLPPDLESRIGLYRRYHESALAFAGAHAGRYYRLVYEDLAQRPEASLRSLMSWLGESYEPQQLRFNEAHHQEGLEDPKVRHTAAIQSTGVGRWRTLLTDEEQTTIWRALGELWAGIDTSRVSWAAGALPGPDATE